MVRASETIRLDDDASAAAECYRALLKRDLGVRAPARGAAGPHPALSWRRSRLDQITGARKGSPLMAPAALTACADGVLAALGDTAPPGALRGWNGAALLGERALLMGLTRSGQTAPGGACRLLPALDGWIAVNLPREDDWSAVDAWLGSEGARDWSAVASGVRAVRVDELIETGRLIGLAVAEHKPERARAWLTRQICGPRAARAPEARPLVLDLSSLWAGPLCASVLAALGARVVKVESTTRPDGARGGEPLFYDLLNWQKQSIALDFGAANGIAALRALISRADIVIESARPRALAQLGVLADRCVAAKAGLTWLSITGHGRAAPQEEWIGFGDDCAVAAGLSWRMRQAHGAPMFCGDAIADPLTGLHAALAAWASWREGGGEIVALSLAGVTAHALTSDPVPAIAVRTQAWAALAADDQHHPYPARRAPRPAPSLGADTARTLAELLC